MSRHQVPRCDGPTPRCAESMPPSRRSVQDSCRCRTRARRGSSGGALPDLRFDSFDGFEMTKYLQMGGLNLGMLLPVQQQLHGQRRCLRGVGHRHALRRFGA